MHVDPTLRTELDRQRDPAESFSSVMLQPGKFASEVLEISLLSSDELFSDTMLAEALHADAAELYNRS